MLYGLDLFSGIGGITLALSEWVRPVVYCEIERYAQAVLLSRMADGTIPIAPIWDDVTTLNAEIINQPVDIIYGGFPCQDISIAGLGAGLAGERSGLFYEIARLVDEIRPKFVFLENVPAITIRGGLDVIREFTNMGYDCRWGITQSGHKPDGFRGERWFLLAKAKSERHQTIQQGGRKEALPRFTNKSSDVRLVIQKPKVESSICGIADGLPCRTHRIKGLGNAVVPVQAKKAFEILVTGKE